MSRYGSRVKIDSRSFVVGSVVLLYTLYLSQRTISFEIYLETNSRMAPTIETVNKLMCLKQAYAWQQVSLE